LYTADQMHEFYRQGFAAGMGLSDAQLDAVLLEYAWAGDELLQLGHAAINASERDKLRAIIRACTPK
jgi:hypothetical protein